MCDSGIVISKLRRFDRRTLQHRAKSRPNPVTRNAYIYVTVDCSEALVGDDIRPRRAHRAGRISVGNKLSETRDAGENRRPELGGFDHHPAPGLLAPEQCRQDNGEVYHRTIPVLVGGRSRPFRDTSLIAGDTDKST